MILRTRGRICALKVRVDVTFDETAADILVFTFDLPGAPVWTIGRDLLDAGLTHQAGDLDIRIWPSPETDEVAIMVDNRSGRAIVRLDWHAVASFVRMTYLLVPRGAEYDDGIEWDAFPRPVIGGAA